VKTVR
jgi:hypothetical protein